MCMQGLNTSNRKYQSASILFGYQCVSTSENQARVAGDKVEYKSWEPPIGVALSLDQLPESPISVSC